jgi:coproporphyrinogen III oxidase-like Fe-S oxidoreductase
VRRTNTGSTSEYVKRVLEGLSAEAVRVELSEEEAVRESLWLGLRLHEGVPAEAFEKVVATLSRDDRERLEDAREAGLLESSPSGRVRLTEKGVLLSSEVFSAFV